MVKKAPQVSIKTTVTEVDCIVQALVESMGMEAALALLKSFEGHVEKEDNLRNRLTQWWNKQAAFLLRFSSRIGKNQRLWYKNH